MITVLCANPALDVTYDVERVTRGAVHTVAHVRRRAGGKGTNVARVLHQLGEPVTVVAPLGDTAGEQYARELDGAGLDLVRVPIAAPPRSSVCVVDGDATVFNEPGPALTAAEWGAVVHATLHTAPEVLVLSGSLPREVPADAYARLVAATTARTVVDTRGDALAAALAAGPDVVAPNLAEAADVTGEHDLEKAARALCSRGAHAAVVSSGADGIVAITADGVWRAVPPRIIDGNPTGAGDALTAEVARGLAHGVPWPELLCDAAATSAAALACAVAGEFDVAVRTDLRARVRVQGAGA